LPLAYELLISTPINFRSEVRKSLARFCPKTSDQPCLNLLNMAKYKLEYIWLDGYTPLASLRSKTQIKEFASFPKLAELPAWGFDGSSTQQAEGKSSDIILKPVAAFPDSTRKNGVLVMCETFLHTGEAHPSNSRATIPDDPDTWFGFEQEYFFFKDGGRSSSVEFARHDPG
jgi:glutamine synthetase